MEEISKEKLSKLREQIYDTIKKIKIDEKRSRIEELKTLSTAGNFWQDNDKAQKTLKELSSLQSLVDEAQGILKSIDGLTEFYDEGGIDEKFIIEQYNQIESDYNSISKYLFLSGKYDNLGVIMSIHAGQGGTEACDWAMMLMRMYTRYFDRKGWSYKVEHIVRNIEAGISTATMVIEGEYAYGLLKNEHGTHRLVRLSPFNAQNLRQTSFAGVDVIPLIEDTEDELVIPDTDIEFKAVRASGPGGQCVNTTSSAVQIKHIPTGITVHCSQERSQLQNRQTAMRILRAKLIKLEDERKESELAKIKGETKKASWGNQVRNYILQPYKLVKDLRTGVESFNPDAVLDGEIDQFIDAGIKLVDIS